MSFLGKQKLSESFHVFMIALSARRSFLFTSSLVCTSNGTFLFFIFFKILFIYERERERETQAPRREPDVGLDPRTPESRPGLKAGAKLLSHPRIPVWSVNF